MKNQTKKPERGAERQKFPKGWDESASVEC